MFLVPIFVSLEFVTFAIASSQTALVNKFTILSLQCKAANWLSVVVGFTAVCLLTTRSTNNKDLATAGLKVIGQ